MGELSEISRTRSLFLVLIVSVTWYAGLHWIMEYPVSSQHMYSAVDAQEYWSVSNWLLRNDETNRTILRPFLYPLMIGIAAMIDGVRGIWILQVLAWLISIVNIHRAVLHATRSQLWPWIASLLLMTNLSFFALTYHALTEVLTICFLSFLTSHLIIRSESWRTPAFHATNMLLLGLLSLMKPVFLPFLLIYLVVTLILFWRWKVLSRRLLIFVFALSPLIPQFMIMKSRHDQFGISTIGSHTIKNYLFVRGYAEVNGMEVELAQQTMPEFSSEEMRSYFLQHWKHFLDIYFTILEDNVYYPGGHTLKMGMDAPHIRSTSIMDQLNKFYCILHVIMLPLCLWMIFSLFRNREYSQGFAWTLIYSMILYLILTSGISFWQGDRLIIPAIACWCLLYPIIIHQIKWPSKLKVKV